MLPLTSYRHESKAIGATRLSDIGEEWKFYDVIGVDEGQFFEDVITATMIKYRLRVGVRMQRIRVRW